MSTESRVLIESPAQNFIRTMINTDAWDILTPQGQANAMTALLNIPKVTPIIDQQTGRVNRFIVPIKGTNNYEIISPFGDSLGVRTGQEIVNENIPSIPLSTKIAMGVAAAPFVAGVGHRMIYGAPVSDATPSKNNAFDFDLWPTAGEVPIIPAPSPAPATAPTPSPVPVEAPAPPPFGMGGLKMSFAEMGATTTEIPQVEQINIGFSEMNQPLGPMSDPGFSGEFSIAPSFSADPAYGYQYAYESFVGPPTPQVAVLSNAALNAPNLARRNDIINILNAENKSINENQMFNMTDNFNDEITKQREAMLSEPVPNYYQNKYSGIFPQIPNRVVL